MPFKMYKENKKIVVEILDCDSWDTFETFDAAYDFIASNYILGV